jgi:predicted branched-subunit amino acid permease
VTGRFGVFGRVGKGKPADDGRGAVWRQALSIGVATGAYGVSFGALSVAAGLSLPQTCTLSLLMFTGGSQFAFAGVIAAGGAGGAAVATAGLLGARNGFYGLQMAPRLRPRGARRLLAAQLTIDESTAVAVVQVAQRPGRDDLVRLGFWATGGSVFVLWNLATLIGGVVGGALGDPRRYGLDAAAAAAFLALLWPRLRAARPRLVALAAVLVALGLVPRVPAGLPVLGAAVVAVALGWKDEPARGAHATGTADARRPEATE